jgi:hypothetical protein
VHDDRLRALSAQHDGFACLQQRSSSERFSTGALALDARFALPGTRSSIRDLNALWRRLLWIGLDDGSMVGSKE